MLGYQTLKELQKALQTPFTGQTAYIEETDSKYVFDGTTWVDYDPELAVEPTPPHLEEPEAKPAPRKAKKKTT